MKYEEFGDESDALMIQQTQQLAFRQIMNGKVSNIFQKVIEMNADAIKDKLDERTYQRIKCFGVIERYRT